MLASLQSAASLLQTATQRLEQKVQEWGAPAAVGAATKAVAPVATLASGPAPAAAAAAPVASEAKTVPDPTKRRRRARAYDPGAPPRPTPRQELNAFYDLITKGTDKPTSTVYDEIIQKEDRTLALMNRLLTDDIQRRHRDVQFVSTPLSRVPLHMFRTLQGILDDLMALSAGKDAVAWRDVIAVFVKDQRAIYLGLWLVVVAVLLLFLESSGSGSNA